MPMYEFYCPDCNTIFTFFSKTVNTAKVPPCPRCKRSALDRMVSRFAVTGRATERSGESGTGETADPPFDAGRMEHAMEALASEAERIDENNPRQAAGLMRKFTAMTGLRFGDKMEDALSRMEAGEDPEALEKEMGDLDEKDLFKLDGMGDDQGKIKAGRKQSPLHDETMYEL
jgi:putative FmdB family regulatory protein